MLIVFAILTIVASLGAWRASPLYSLKATFKLVGATAVIGAVAWGASWAIISGPLKNSVAGQLAVGIPAFLLVSTGAMVMIVRITDRHVAELPGSVKLVTLHRHRIVRSMVRMVMYLLLCTAAAMVVPADWQWLPEMMGGFPLLVCGPMLGVMYMMARRNDRGMTSIMTNPWAHWEYTPEQWEAWTQNELAWENSKMTPMTLKGAALMVLICAVLFALGVLMNGGFHGENNFLFLGLCGFIVLLLLVFYIFVRLHPGRRRRMLMAAPPEAWFGDEGMYGNGEYIPWTMSGQFLVKGERENGPPLAVVFVFDSFNGSTSTTLSKRILVPAGHDADLGTMEKKLNAQCKTAFVRFAER